MEKQGSNLLKVCGIIMIIGGAISIVLALLSVTGVAVIVAGGAQNAPGFIGLVFITAIGVLASIIQLIAGIKGAKNWNVPQKANSCLRLGVIIIILNVISFVYNIATIGSGFNPFTNLIVGLILPVLYVVGAVQLKKQA